MAAGDLESTFILRAADLSSQPIKDVVAQVEKLIQAQDKLNESAKNGTVTNSDFKKSLADLQAVFKALVDQKAALTEFGRANEVYATQLEKVEAAQKRLDDRQKALPPPDERTPRQVAQLEKLEKGLLTAQNRADTAQKYFDLLTVTMERMGVSVEQLADAEAHLAATIDLTAPAIQRASVANLSLLENRTKAAAAAKAQEEAEKQLAEQYKADQAERLRLYNEEIAAADRLASKKALDAQEEAKFRRTQRQNDLETVFRPVLDKQDTDAKRDVAAASDIESINRKARDDAREANREAQELSKLRVDQEKASANAIAEIEKQLTEQYKADQAEKLRLYEEEIAASDRVAKKKAFDAQEEIKFRRAQRQTDLEAVFRPVLDRQDADAKRDVAVGSSIESINRKASDDAREASREAQQLSKVRVDQERASANAIAEIEKQLSDLYKADQAEKLRLYEEEIAASDLLAKKKAFDAQEEIKFRRAQRQSELEFSFAPLLAQQEAEEALAKSRIKANQDQQRSFEALAESRQKVARATDAIPATLPVGQAEAPPGDFNRASEGLAKIRGDQTSLAGIIAEVTSASAVLEGARKKDEEYQSSLRRLAAAFVDLTRVAKLADIYKTNEAAAQRLDAELAKERVTFASLTAQFQAAGKADTDLEQRLLRQANVVKNLSNAFNEQNAKLSETRATMEAAGVSVHNFDADVAALHATAESAQNAFSKINAATGRGADGFRILGLRPYEFKNLTYQINDVFTQLASGTSLSQTFAQQFGQIFQLYEDKLGKFILKVRETPGALAAMGVGVGIATVAVLALARAFEDASAKRELLAQQTLSSDKNYDIDALLESAKAAERLGASASEAKDSVKELFKVNIPQSYITSLAEAAQNLSRATGKKNADTTKELIAAFTGGAEAVRKFSVEYKNLLNFDTSSRIENLLNEGKLEQARAELLSAIYLPSAKAARDATSALGQAWIDLKDKWNDLLEAFGAKSALDYLTSFFATTLREVRGILSVVTDLTNLLGRLPKIPFIGTPTQSTPQTGNEPAQSNPNALNLRNNNPVNLEFVRQAGATVGEGGRFARFATPEAGVSAALGQALFDQQSRGLKSIQDFIYKYTPPVSRGGDNPDAKVERYIEAVARELGVGRTQAINLSDREIAIKYITAVARQEGGVPSQAAIQRGVDSRLGAAPAGSSTDAERLTNASRTATAEFVKQEQARIDQQGISLTREEELARRARVLDQSREDIQARAYKFAQENRAGQLKQADVDAIIAKEREKLQREFDANDLRALKEVQDRIREAQSKAKPNDPTNVDEARATVIREFSALREGLRDAQAAGKTLPGGQTYERALEQVNQLQGPAIARAELDAFKAGLDKLEKERAEIIKQITEQGKASNRDPAQTLEFVRVATQQRTKDIQELAAKIVEKQRDFSATPGGNEVIQRANLAISRRDQPPEALSAVTEVTTEAEKPFTDLIKTRDDQVKVIVNLLHARTITLSDALKQLNEVGATLGPKLQEAYTKARTALQVIAANPLTPELQRSDIRRRLSEIQAANAKGVSDELNEVITAGVKDDQERLTALTADRDRAFAEIFRKLSDGIFKSPSEGMAALLAAAQKFNGEIKDASKKVADLIRTALAAPDLTPGARAELNAKLDQANRAGDVGRTTQEGARKVIDTGISNLQNNVVGSVRDTQSTQSQLLAKGLTTPAAAEDAIRQAYSEANKAAAVQIAELNEAINLYEKFGDVAPEQVQKLRDKLKLVQADLQYISPLTQQLIKGIADSFATRGVQVFEDIAKAIAKIGTNGFKLKDVFSSVGIAFANFAAGMLQDIARIIIKYELLALIKTVLGIGPGGGGPVGAAHEGGEITGTRSNMTKVVDLSVFRTARRMHSGGSITGLSAGEVPIIAQQGEYVLSRAEVQRQKNMASMMANTSANGGGGGGTSIRNVLAVGDQEIASAMNGSHGEQVVLNHLRRNAPTIKKWVG